MACLELEDHPLYARLREGVVVLYRVEQLGEAPVGIRLHLLRGRATGSGSGSGRGRGRGRLRLGEAPVGISVTGVITR